MWTAVRCGAVRPLRAARRQGGGVAGVGGGEPRPVDPPPARALRPPGAHLPAMELVQQHALRHTTPPHPARRRGLRPDRQGVGLVRRPTGAEAVLPFSHGPSYMLIKSCVVRTCCWCSDPSTQGQLLDTADTDGGHGVVRVTVAAPPPALGRPRPRRRGARTRRGHRAPVLRGAQGVPLRPPLRLLPLAAPLHQGAPTLYRYVYILLLVYMQPGRRRRREIKLIKASVPPI
jgi:hypothetical protein